MDQRHDRGLGVRSTIRRIAAGSSSGPASSDRSQLRQGADRPLQRITARVELDGQPVRYGRPGRIHRGRVAADQAQPRVHGLGVGLRARGREPGRADPGVDGEADLQRLGVRAERPLDPAGGGHGQRHGHGDLLGRQPQRDGRPGGAGRRPGRAGGVPAGRVVRPAQGRPQPRHHPRRGQVGARAAARGQRRRHADRADVRGRRHVQVVEVQHVPGHGPARAVGQARGQPGDAMVAGGQRDRHRVRQATGRPAPGRPAPARAARPTGPASRPPTSSDPLLPSGSSAGTPPRQGLADSIKNITPCPLQRRVDVETASRLRLGSPRTRSSP